MSKTRLQLNKETFVAIFFTVLMTTLIIATLVSTVTVLRRIYLNGSADGNQNPIDTESVNEALRILSM
ncbi:hypothetical protein A2154_02920 [Candidatus Gottesmanbacteria bacterium RBG_16_43_7]|uniref:Uncharacterized protein n=1 Tax=Candidatus Gottesmanbacteria bacterium RBG_16_43_7 TaxID=1798373 RepID=A0A1F5Z928_9BACT|nr:MAG: hypothetical protein A2154_02920 [Candidatus Gottesmanbacteria bacterium RBG_16_43_7]